MKWTLVLCFVFCLAASRTSPEPVKPKVQKTEKPSKPAKAIGPKSLEQIDPAERATKTYYDSLAKARVLRQSFRRRNRPIYDVQDMYFAANNTVFEFRWRKNRFVRMPVPLNHSLSKYLTQVPQFTASGRRINRRKPYLLVPLYDRYRIRRQAPRQTQCTLDVRLHPLRHYIDMGVVLIRLTVSSNCLHSEFIKFLWANSFDKTTHLAIGFQGRRFHFTFDKPKEIRTGDRGTVYEYELMKNLRPYRAPVFTLSSRMRAMTRRAQVSRSTTPTRGRVQTKTRRLSKAPNHGRARKLFLGRLFGRQHIPVPVKRQYFSRRTKFYSFGELNRDSPYKSAMNIDNILDRTFDGLPNIPWTSAGDRFTIFSKSNDGMMKWTLKEVQRFVETPNPLLCRTRFIRRLKDSQVICNL